MDKNLLKEKILNMGGVVKTSDLYQWGITYRKMDAYLKEGFLFRVKNGYYGIQNKEQTQEELMEALFSDGVLTMETALYYYGYLKQKPFYWVIAVDKNTSKSRFSIVYPVVVPVYTEAAVLNIGITEITIKKHPFQIYNKDRLICDCLKQEDRFGHEEFKMILQAYIGDNEKNIHQLLLYAKERKVLGKVKDLIGVWL